MEQLVERLTDERGPAAIHRIHLLAIGDEDAHQMGEVVAAPETTDIGLARADSAAERGVREHLRMIDVQRTGEITRSSAFAEAMLVTALDHA